MANRIVRINPNLTQNKDLEVYSDIDIVSTPKSTNRFKYDSLKHESNLRTEIPEADYYIRDPDETHVITEDSAYYTKTHYRLRNEELNMYIDDPTIDKAKERDDKLKSQYRITKDVNVKAVFNSIRNIFNWIPGERILDPEFGSKIRMYLYEGITEFNKEQIISEIDRCCLKWDPRIKILKIRDVSTNEDTENNTVRLDIIFTIPTLSDEQYTYSYIYTRTD